MTDTESTESKEAKPTESTQVKKGLMERRRSFAQSSVPNAHRGYSKKTPVIMLIIYAAFFVISIILAKLTA